MLAHTKFEDLDKGSLPVCPHMSARTTDGNYLIKLFLVRPEKDRRKIRMAFYKPFCATRKRNNIFDIDEIRRVKYQKYFQKYCFIYIRVSFSMQIAFQSCLSNEFKISKLHKNFLLTNIHLIRD